MELGRRNAVLRAIHDNWAWWMISSLVNTDKLLFAMPARVGAMVIAIHWALIGGTLWSAESDCKRRLIAAQSGCIDTEHSDN